MSLLLWMPMTDDTLKSQGLCEVNASMSNTVTETRGKLGKCCKITGQINTGLPQENWDYETGSVTMCCWVKYVKSEVETYLGSKVGTNVQPTSVLLGRNDFNGLGLVVFTNTLTNGLESMKVRTSIRDSVTICSTDIQTIQFGTWTHQTLVYDNGSLKHYINGNLVSEKTYTKNGNYTNKGTVMINQSKIYSGNGPAVNFPCYINDVRVYNHALSSKEIELISRGLVLHYPMNLFEKASSPKYSVSVNDLTEYDTSGFLNNGEVASATCPTLVSDSPRYDGSYKFNEFTDGNSNVNHESTAKIITCSNFLIPEGSISIVFWMKRANLIRHSVLLTDTAANSDITLCGIITYDNLFRLNLSNGYKTIEYPFNTTDWVHVALTYDGTTIKTYLNGVLYKSVAGTGDIKLTNGGLIIGKNKAGGVFRYFNGQLSDFRIYATALSQDAVLELYNTSAILTS